VLAQTNHQSLRKDCEQFDDENKEAEEGHLNENSTALASASSGTMCGSLSLDLPLTWT
jgi:hypothetical protein